MSESSEASPGRADRRSGPDAGEPRRETVQRLWEEHAASLRAYLRRRTSTDEEAEELLQECFLRVHAGLDGLRDTQRVGPWIHAIASRLVVDARRRGGRRGADLPAADALGAPEEPEDLDGIVAGWLGSLMGELDELDRETLRLAELEGRPLSEVAERMDLSLTATKSRVQRARARLRDRLLACCEIELDRRGGVAGWRHRREACDDC